MPNTSSATRELRHQQRRISINLRRRKVLKNSLVNARKQPQSTETLQIAYKQIGKAKKNGILTPNKASRLQAKLAKNFNAAQKETPKAPRAAAKPKASKAAAKN